MPYVINILSYMTVYHPKLNHMFMKLAIPNTAEDILDTLKNGQYTQRFKNDTFPNHKCSFINKMKQVTRYCVEKQLEISIKIDVHEKGLRAQTIPV